MALSLVYVHSCFQTSFKGTSLLVFSMGEHYTDKNILDESYYVVSKTFPGFPSLGVKNCFLFKVELLVLSNSVLPKWEIREMFN